MLKLAIKTYNSFRLEDITTTNILLIGIKTDNNKYYLITDGYGRYLFVKRTHVLSFVHYKSTITFDELKKQLKLIYVNGHNIYMFNSIKELNKWLDED